MFAPSRGRELKSFAVPKPAESVGFAPSRGRELKFLDVEESIIWRQFAPSRGRELKFVKGVVGSQPVPVCPLAGA